MKDYRCDIHNWGSDEPCYLCSNDVDRLQYESTAAEVELEDVVSWADGILGALGTEHAHKVTDAEALIAGVVLKAFKSLPC